MKNDISLESPVQYLKTVGPVRARALQRLGIATVSDLLAHYPRRYFDRSSTTPIGRIRPGQEVTIEAEVMTAGERRMRPGRTIQTVAVADRSGTLFCVWFGQSYLLKQFRSGSRVMCSGVVQFRAGRRQIVHPDFEILSGESEPLHTGRLVPQYPATSGIGQHWLRRLIHGCLAELKGQIAETLPAELRRHHGLLAREQALQQIHFPADPKAQQQARLRLAYDELLEIQLIMAMRRRDRQRQAGIKLEKPGDMTLKLVEGLPFKLTSAQRRVLREILADLRSGHLMHRLLQGDVGSGKTLVALISALFVIEQGYQAIIMAPTEVLARQHGQNIARLTRQLDCEVATLTGSTPAAERRGILQGAARGDLALLIGTHALIEETVHLPRLALAVVDEQHRFGVQQRGRTAQADQGAGPAHVLVMSATPIPRSLSLTLYGDLELSVIDELPHGRKPIQTLIAESDEEARVYAEVEHMLAAGGQGYIIYPVIEETEKQDLKAATVEYEKLVAGPFRTRRLALLHGRLKAREKETIMADFQAKRLDLLVATTVIEVGVDVANATAMVIHNPERFGLAQLHQLRGRIGRGPQRASCTLVVDSYLAPETRERLEFFAAHTDGFELAEEDLRRRGPGDIWGVRQHGLPGFRLVNPLRDKELVKMAGTDAVAWLARDPGLRSAEGSLLWRSLERNYARLLPLATG